MSPIDKGFRERTQAVFNLWVDEFSLALDKGKKNGKVKKGVNSRDVALFLVSQIEGTLSIAKNAQNSEILYIGLKNMNGFLQSLKPK